MQSAARKALIHGPQVSRYSDAGDISNRTVKKHAELIASLQKGLASVEARLVEYQVRSDPTVGSCVDAILRMCTDNLAQLSGCSVVYLT